MRLLLAVKADEPPQMAALAAEIAWIARSNYKADGVGNGPKATASENTSSSSRHGCNARVILPQLVTSIEVANAFAWHADRVLAACWPMHDFVAARSIEDANEQLRKGRQSGRSNRSSASSHGSSCSAQAFEAMAVVPLPAPNEAALVAARAYGW